MHQKNSEYKDSKYRLNHFLLLPDQDLHYEVEQLYFLTHCMMNQGKVEAYQYAYQFYLQYEEMVGRGFRSY